MLAATSDIRHVGNRMRAFFSQLGSDHAAQSPSIASEGMEAFHLPGVHFEGKLSPLYPLEAELPTEWIAYIHELGEMLEIDETLVIAFILHESGGDPTAHNADYFDDPMQQASGLMQIIPFWHRYYLDGGLYYDNYADNVIAFAEQNGADINNLFDPLGNITVGMMMLSEQRKLCNDPTDKREWVDRQTGGEFDGAVTVEILYYRDQLAKQNGYTPWYSDEYYDSQMV